jgi:hypothetical protein
MTKKQERFTRDKAAGFAEALEEQETSKYERRLRELEKWDKFIEEMTWEYDGEPDFWENRKDGPNEVKWAA